MGPKRKQKGSPSKSEPGGRSTNLLRSALAKSRSERTSSIMAASASPTPGSTIADITNIPHRGNISRLSSTRSV